MPMRFAPQEGERTRDVVLVRQDEANGSDIPEETKDAIEQQLDGRDFVEVRLDPGADDYPGGVGTWLVDKVESGEGVSYSDDGRSSLPIVIVADEGAIFEFLDNYTARDGAEEVLAALREEPFFVHILCSDHSRMEVQPLIGR